MTVSPEVLKKDGVIEPFDPRGQRVVSYDLGIGAIFAPHDAQEWKEYGLKPNPEGFESYDLPPQGIAVIVSSEKLKVPKNMLAHALPKSSLCEKGLLLLNTGLVDPDWEGPLVGTVLNFGNVPISLRKGDRFIRLVFTKFNFSPPDEYMPTRVPEKDRGSIADKYPFYFLNWRDNVRKIAKEAVDDAFPRVGINVAYYTLLIAVITIIVTAIILWIDKGQLDDRVRQLELKAASAGQGTH